MLKAGKRSSGEKLCLLKPEISLKKHPSVKSLFPEFDNNEIINKIKNFGFNNDKNSSQFRNSNYNFTNIIIISCEPRLSQEEETFFMEDYKEKEKDIIKDNLNSNDFYKDKNIYGNNKKPFLFCLTDEQKKLDKKITQGISEGKNFQFIENSFKGLLKK